jgi:hypothetical protein
LEPVARSIEQFLRAAVKSERTLNDDEVPVLRAGIALLRSTASAEMQAARWPGSPRYLLIEQFAFKIAGEAAKSLQNIE